MATEKKTKTKSFGGANVAQIKPASVDELPPFVNVVISFEEALKFHLSVGQALAKINSYLRSTAAGKGAAVMLSLQPERKRIVVYETDIIKAKKEKISTTQRKEPSVRVKK